MFLRDYRSFLTLGLCAAFSVGLSACSHHKPKDDDTAPASVEMNDLGNSDEGKALGMSTIHFAFDSDTLNSEAKSSLVKNASILKANPAVKVQIEGHCDARGGIQYNIALGEKRATAVKHYLQDEGIAEDRLTTISYGKERPLVAGDTEEAYAKNRRAVFTITAKPM